VTTRPTPLKKQPSLLEHAPESLDEARAWDLLQALARRAAEGRPVSRPMGLDVDDTGELIELGVGRGVVTLAPGATPCFELSAPADAKVVELFDLYLPLCVGKASAKLVVGHLGQSLDGQIATSSGASQYVTGPENIRHLHRLRALFDAVIVGANTVECDNPQLTTRLVPGPNPTRVVLDPKRRLRGTQTLFRDQAAPTLVLCALGSQRENGLSHAEVLGIEATGELLPVSGVIAALRARGLNRLFVEGGGVTVSRFLAARAFDRLHLTVSSVFLGTGRPGVKLPGIDRLDAALRPRVRRFLLGEDVLFDCDFDDAKS
jgi:diaminohydroxyphosphoribosylaminopyrimidine deaminase / 5-amino-6-(5-phosphoribosylamino)uracil reductase